MGDWISVHTQGWPIFLTATTLLSVSAAWARARGRSSWTWWLFWGVWGAAVLALYVQLGVHRFSGYARHLWSAQIATLALITLVPLVLVLMTLWLWTGRNLVGKAWRGGAAMAAVVGAMGMLFAPALSGWMFHLLQSWVAQDHH